MKQLSIIIPIYNVEEYLVRCFDSIYSQEVSEDIFEVVAIIDGSPDNCYDIATEYAKNHKNLTVVNKENGGVSSARNKGVEIAQGKYIMFIDPDDCLLPNSLKDVFITINKHKADFVILRSFMGNEEKEVYAWENTFEIDTTYSGIDIYDKGCIRGSVMGVLFNKDFLSNNHLCFPTNVKNSEDSIFFLQCQLWAKNVLFANIKIYSITIRLDSASRNITENRLRDWFKALQCLISLKRDNHYKGIEESMIDGLLYAIMSDITNKSINLMGWKALEFLHANQVTQYLPVCKENIKRSSFINAVIKNIINKSFNLYFFLIFVRNKM